MQLYVSGFSTNREAIAKCISAHTFYIFVWYSIKWAYHIFRFISQLFKVAKPMSQLPCL